MEIVPHPQPAELFERIRWPATIGFLSFLLLLCLILVVGVCRNSRCSLILFSVVGLFGVIICWLLSGVYLASTVAIGDFCMQPTTHFCNKLAGVSNWPTRTRSRTRIGSSETPLRNYFAHGGMRKSVNISAMRHPKGTDVLKTKQRLIVIIITRRHSAINFRVIIRCNEKCIIMFVVVVRIVHAASISGMH